MRTRNGFFALIGLLPLGVWAAGPDDAKGTWMSEEKDGVVAFAPCPQKPSALCGVIVWDKDADKSPNTCGLQIAQLESYAKDSWRDGWVFDPRDNKKYKAVIRVKQDELHLRAFIGAEVLGQTAVFTKVTALPETPSCPKTN